MIVDQVRKILEDELVKLKEEHQIIHFLSVLKFAKALQEKHGGDLEIIEIAVWLHDITRVRKTPGDHNITGAEEAGHILQEMGYPEDKIKQVQHCITEHCTGRNPETIEAKIISVADALSHYEMIPYFFWVQAKEGMEYEKVLDWVSDKIHSDWEKRLPILPGSQELVKDKYEAFKTLMEGL